MEKYIGNIIVNSQKSKIDNYFKKCVDIANIDIGIPTLIIGYERAKKIIGTKFHILNKKYDDQMLWWTFSKTERRVDYDKDVEDFKKFCINKITNNIIYYNINIINLNYNNIKRIYKFINNNNNKIYYIDNNKFVFLYDLENTKHVYGFSLSTCELLGVPKNKILKIIANNPQNIKITDFSLIPNGIRNIVSEDVPSELVMEKYFKT